MRRNKVKPFKQEDYALLDDLTIAPDVVAFMIGVPNSRVSVYRHKKKYAESLRKASAKFRKKKKKENLARFDKTHGCYNYWSEEEIAYLLESDEADDVIAKKLNRTVDAIQKKRQRELLKGR